MLDERLVTVHEDNMGVYGVRKMWKTINRLYPGEQMARCTVERRMRALGLAGVSNARSTRTTRPAPAADARPQDKVNRDFTAALPDQRWVADITYVPTWSGFCYVAFVMDLFSRRIVGWQTSTRMRTDLALDALDMGLWSRCRAGQDVSGLTHHSDHGCQGGFQWSSQHLDVGGVRWDARGSKCHKRRPMLVGSGRRIGHYGRRCDHRADRNPRARWSARSGA